MAVFILNERMSGLRWCSVLLGFVGVLIIMRPGMNNGFGWAVLLPLCLAFLYAAFQVYTRKYAHHDNPLSLLFFSGLVGAVLVSFVAPFFWQTLSWADIAWLMLLGLLGCLGHGFMIRAFAHAPATVLAPFLYVQIIFVTTLAWLLLGQIPDRISLIGMGVIVMAGLIAALLQVKEKRQEDRMANAEIISPTPE
jgi:drug/metabolite transporter (DMT)-like permease